MALCLINSVTLHNLPYGSHKMFTEQPVMCGKLDKCFDMIRINVCKSPKITRKGINCDIKS